jgi:diguanylate cyclase (GGDEF)-like protein/PAS domain S-box-containing protein
MARRRPEPRAPATPDDRRRVHAQDERRGPAELIPLGRHPGASVLVYDQDLRVELAVGPLFNAPEAQPTAGRPVSEVLPAGSAAVIGPHLRAALAGESRSLEHRTGERTHWLEIEPLRGDDDTVGAGLAVALDVTERASAVAALRESEERFRTAFDDAPIGIALVALDGRFMRVNDALSQLVGFPPRRLVATTLPELSHPDDSSVLERQLRRLTGGEIDVHRWETRCLHADGHVVYAALDLALVRDRAGEPQHLVVQAQDITDRKRYEDQLQFMADHDPLTGLLNRRGFERELERHVARLKRYGPEGALLALDLDHFKYINDTLGHNAGDELIASVTGILRRRLRRSDTLARLGGDEFAVLLPRADREQARAVAQSLVDGLRGADIRVGPGLPAHTTTSIGVTMFDEPELSGEEMLIRADLAMYDAKESGRDRYAFYAAEGDDAQPRMRVRLTWVDRIRAALREDRLVLHAQPIISLAENQPAMQELLLRMIDEGGDVILPASFLYVAERFDLIQEIDRWVTQNAIGLLARNPPGGGGLPVSVNLSGKSLADAELLRLLETELRDSGVEPGRLVFEITETAAIANIQLARRFSERLRELGCRLALDDFGSGFGSFYYLKHLPFDYLKIDGEFVTHCLTSQTDQLLIEAVVMIAHGLGKLTIAEYTPDQATLDFLRRRGVDYTQSFHTGAPRLIEIPPPRRPR